VIFAMLIVFSCDDQHAEELDKSGPTIDILLPERNIVYSPGDTVFIHANLSDDKALRKGSVHIHDQFLPAPADTVFSYEFIPTGNHFELDTFWIVNDPFDKSYTIYVEGADKAENFTQNLRYFHQFH
jgi:hypothetical protein